MEEVRESTRKQMARLRRLAGHNIREIVGWGDDSGNDANDAKASAPRRAGNAGRSRGGGVHDGASSGTSTSTTNNASVPPHHHRKEKHIVNATPLMNETPEMQQNKSKEKKKKKKRLVISRHTNPPD